MPASAVEILVIGNEVLAGAVLDTNSHWLCRELAARGARVTRVTVLPDDPAAIGEALLAARSRRPALILTCGGLGPTADDLTVAAIAAALQRPIGEHPHAYALIRDFYAQLFARGEVTTPEMTQARAKMAQMPHDAEPLMNTVGAAPGVLLHDEGMLIVSLPGVPAEMKDIFTHALWPRLAASFHGQVYGERTVLTDCWDESILAPAVDAVARRHPTVYVKSRAQVYGSGLADFVTLAARGRNAVEVAGLLDAAQTDMISALATVGIRARDAARAEGAADGH
jgi:molybdenum cofactor synthesis domain-containing protein